MIPRLGYTETTRTSAALPIYGAAFDRFDRVVGAVG